MIHWTAAIIRACRWTRRNGLPYRVNHKYALDTLKNLNVWRRPPTICEHLMVIAIWLLLIALVVVIGWTTHSVTSTLLIH